METVPHIEVLTEAELGTLVEQKDVDALREHYRHLMSHYVALHEEYSIVFQQLEKLEEVRLRHKRATREFLDDMKTGFSELNKALRREDDGLF